MEVEKSTNLRNCSKRAVNLPNVKTHAPDIIILRAVFFAYFGS